MTGKTSFETFEGVVTEGLSGSKSLAEGTLEVAGAEDIDNPGIADIGDGVLNGFPEEVPKVGTGTVDCLGCTFVVLSLRDRVFPFSGTFIGLGETPLIEEWSSRFLFVLGLETKGFADDVSFPLALSDVELASFRWVIPVLT